MSMLIGLLLLYSARGTQLQPYGQCTGAASMWLMKTVFELPLILHPIGLEPTGTLTMMPILLGIVCLVGMSLRFTVVSSAG